MLYLFSCYGNRCNVQHVQNFEFKLEEEYKPAQALLTLNATECFDTENTNDPANTDLCISCVSCEYFVDSNGVSQNDENCANFPENAEKKFFLKVRVLIVCLLY